MQVTSLCPFAVSTLLWEAQPSQFSLTVTVKATFALVAGAEARVHERQEPLTPDRHWDDRPMASLFAPADQAPSKRRVDVLLVGHAYAPAETPAVSMVARFALGDALDKSVRVTGDRFWEAGEGGALKPSAVVPFMSMPLRYERAPLSAENPVGIDASAPPHLGSPARPNLEPLEGATMGGFGPVASTWRERRTRVDDAGLFWAFGVGSDTPARTGPPPSSFDFSFFNAAPPEQQIELVRAGMKIELENMNASHPAFASAVPAIRPQVFRVAKGGGRAEEITLRCDTLWIDTDRELLVLTFRGVADAGDGNEDELGKLVVVADPGGKKLRWDRVQKLCEAGLGNDTAPSEGGSGPADPGAGVDRDPLSVRYDAVLDEATKGTVPEMLPEPPRLSSERPRNPRNKTTVPPRPLAAAKTTPPPPMPVAAPLPIQDDEDPAPERTQPLPIATIPGGIEAMIDDDTTATVSGHHGRGLSTRDIAVVMAAPRGDSAASDDVDEPTRAHLGKRPVASSSTAIIEPADVGLFAAVSAHLARKGIDRLAVFSAHGMSDAAFAALADRFRTSVEAEGDRGKRDLMSAFDMAYVAAQERLDPPIGIVEYAQIVVALERGTVGRVLAELDLELSDLMRLQRVWSRRAAASPEITNSLNAAIEAKRRD